MRNVIKACATVALVWGIIGLYRSGAPALAPSVLAQGAPTATPDAAGVIYVVVQPNDSLWSVAARGGISLPELLELNDLTETAVIQPGQLLIVAIVTPAPTETPVVTPTATPPRPTVTPTSTPPPTGVCLLAFDDVNGDGIFNRGEGLKTAVAFTIFDAAQVVANYVTDGVSEPHCLLGMAPGTYQITRSVARGEILTTPGDRGIIVEVGDVVSLQFGSRLAELPAAAETAVAPAAPARTNEAPAPPNRRPWYVIGGILLLGVIFWAVVRRRK